MTFLSFCCIPDGSENDMKLVYLYMTFSVSVVNQRAEMMMEISVFLHYFFSFCCIPEGSQNDVRLVYFYMTFSVSVVYQRAVRMT